MCRPRRGGHLTALQCAGATFTGDGAALVAFTPKEQRYAHRMTLLHSCLQAGAQLLSVCGTSTAHACAGCPAFNVIPCLPWQCMSDASPNIWMGAHAGRRQ